MVKFDKMIGKQFEDVFKACKKSSILKAIGSAACFWMFLILFDESSQELGFVKGGKRMGHSADKIVEKLIEEDKITKEDYFEAQNKYNEEAVKKQ